MEIIIIAVVAVVLGAIIYSNRRKSMDVNKDGKVNLADAKVAVKNTVTEVKAVADVNKDGKVDKADAKAATKKATTAVKNAADKAKTAAKTKTAKAGAGKPKMKVAK